MKKIKKNFFTFGALVSISAIFIIASEIYTKFAINKVKKCKEGVDENE